MLSSHITDDLEKIADYVTMINRGAVAFSQPKDQLLDNWKRIIVKDREAVDRVRPWLVYREPESCDRVGYTDRYVELRRTLAAHLAAGQVVAESVSLAEIMLAVVKGGKE